MPNRKVTGWRRFLVLEGLPMAERIEIHLMLRMRSFKPLQETEVSLIPFTLHLTTLRGIAM